MSAIAASEKTKLTDLVKMSDVNTTTSEEIDDLQDSSDYPKVVVVTLPSRYTEEKVATLISSMEAQFEGTGYKVIFAPEEVKVYEPGSSVGIESRR